MKEDALNKYQENGYLLGKIFSVGNEESLDSSDSYSSSEEDMTNPVDEESQMILEQI